MVQRCQVMDERDQTCVLLLYPFKLVDSCRLALLSSDQKEHQMISVRKQSVPYATACAESMTASKINTNVICLPTYHMWLFETTKHLSTQKLRS